MNASRRYHRTMDFISSVRSAHQQAIRHFSARQAEGGQWTGDYGGPLFLLPGLVIAYEVTGAMSQLEPSKRTKMIDYLFATQQNNGGWGLHISGSSTMFGTVLNYTALRLLGVGSQMPQTQRARQWIQDHGGAEAIPSWGKCWLAILGVYPWQGLNPLPPELWILPRILPFHPSRFWCHTRAVFLPMSYLYGIQFQGEITDLVKSLRKELFTRPWHEVDWKMARDTIAPGDRYAPHSHTLKCLNLVLRLYEYQQTRVGIGRAALRRRALKRVAELVHHEDESTDYLTIGPVAKPLHLITAWSQDSSGPAYQRHLDTIDDAYLWAGEDGIKMQGYPFGSQCWDTSFALQALAEGITDGPDDLSKATIARAYSFVAANQIENDISDGKRYYRDRIKGMWPFSVARQAWPVTDCTAEAMRALLLTRSWATDPITPACLLPAIDRLLEYQNSDGGWSEYERSRASPQLEALNAADIFGDIMIAYSYTECTSACIRALLSFRHCATDYRAAEILAAIRRGRDFLRDRQRDDGSWYGGWGVCFTYGTWFGVEGLLSAGEPRDSERIRQACHFLQSKELPEGGWGESYRACEEKQWIAGDFSCVQSAWALLTLMAADDPSGSAGVNRHCITRGIRALIAGQKENGDWPRQALTGVFNRNCMINYDNYRNIMPLWALGRFVSKPWLTQDSPLQMEDNP